MDKFSCVCTLEAKLLHWCLYISSGMCLILQLTMTQLATEFKPFCSLCFIFITILGHPMEATFHCWKIPLLFLFWVLIILSSEHISSCCAVLSKVGIRMMSRLAKEQICTENVSECSGNSGSIQPSTITSCQLCLIQRGKQRVKGKYAFPAITTFSL